MRFEKNSFKKKQKKGEIFDFFFGVKFKKMGMENGESCIKKILRSLCLSHGWTYGVFWRFDPRNHMMLTMEDGYCEGHAANLMESMLVQLHMLGEGIIGEVALEGKQRWMLAYSSKEILEDSQFGFQFSCGIKTIAVIPIEMRGVVQFGSTKEIFEAQEFLDQARKCLQDQSLDESGQNRLSASVIASQNPFFDDVSTSWGNGIENSLLFDSLHFPGDLITDPSSGSLVKDAVDVFTEHFEPAHFPASLLETCQTDDFSQWLADSSKLCVSGLDLEAMLSDDMSSDLGGSNNIFSNIQGSQSACSSQSSLTHNVLDSCKEGKPSVVGANNNELLTEFGIDLGSRELGDVINTVEDKINPWPIDTGMRFSECISEVVGGRGHSIAAPKKGLFSELGLEHLLKDGSTIKSCIEDQWPSSKKRRVEAYEMVNDQIQQTYHSWGVKSMQPSSTSVQMQDFGSLKECMEKAQSSYSIDAKSCISSVNAKMRKTEEPPKASKKRARPGESTRPRPKDRQLIADRIKDLRDLIPNGAKLSIDALLGRTIKHMLFLQNLNKHGDKLKQADEPKLIDQNNGLIQKGSSASISSGGSGRGATWAYEVGGSNLLCPIIVEDLNEPGQMLIEMLCEERGYFLEIADIIRGFGLTILKGVMESRNDKIWAHFIVEGNKHVTRMDVFVSLMHLLQGTNTSEVVNTACEPTNIVSDAAPLWGNFQQHMVPLPI